MLHYIYMVPFWRNYSLSTKFGSLVSGVSVLTVLLLTGFNIWREWRNFEQGLLGQASILLNASSIALREPLSQSHPDDVVRYATILKQDENISLIVIFDGSQQAVASFGASDPAVRDAVEKLKVDVFAGSESRMQVCWLENVLITGRQISLDGKPVGAILLGLSTRPLVTKIQNITFQSTLVAFFVLAGGGLLSLWTVHQITRPLADLTHVATEMGRGNTSIRVVPQSNDEVGRLGAVFNQMADAMQERETALRDLALDLEKMVAQRTAELSEQAARLEELAVTDPLTQIYNRRYFFDLAEKEFERAARHKRPLAVMIMDADHFKKINDTYGHAVGDQALLHLTSLCKENIRLGDVLARYGGEEFVLLLPETNLNQALHLAERLRSVVEQSPLVYEGVTIPLTLSLGLNAQPGGAGPSLLEFMHQADLALYRAKNGGRNQVCWWVADNQNSG